jgi:hypothetical protein
MKRMPLIAVALALSAVPLVQGQTMVEYSGIATHSAGALAAPNLSRGHKAVDHYGTTHGRLWQEKNAGVKDENPSPPAPPAVFILKTGERMETGNYFLTTDSLRINKDDKQRIVPLSAVDLNATLAANHQRGLDLKIPANKAQITLGF